MTKITQLLLIANILLVTSCIPLNRMESARTLGKGNNSSAATLTAYVLDEESIINGVLPHFDLKYSRGITDQLDVAIGLASLGFITLDTKYQIVGNQDSPFNIALGLSGEVYPWIRSKNKSPKNYFQLSIPVYFSYHFKSNLYIFGIPQYSRQFSKKNDSNQFLGSSIGLGYRYSIFEFNAGGSYFKVLNSKSIISQYGFGFKYHF